MPPFIAKILVQEMILLLPENAAKTQLGICLGLVF